jgi:DNA repair protein RecN (Recombination protein N)
MLLELHIKNLAIIDELTIEFGDGLCAITGETGAGKSLVIGALKLALGERGGGDRIRTGADEMEIWARFSNDEITQRLEALGYSSDELIIARKIYSSGRTSFWVNAKPATADFVREIGRNLVDIHGQHSHQRLLDSSSHIELLDGYAHTGEYVAQVEKLYIEYFGLTKQLDELVATRDEILKRQRLLKYDLDELSAAGLGDPREEETLEKEFVRLESAEALINFSQKLNDSLVEGDENVRTVVSALEKEARKYAGINEIDQVLDLLTTVSAAIDELGILANNIGHFDYNPRRLEKIRERLGVLGDLQRKHRKPIGELIEYVSNLKNEIVDDFDLDEAESELRKKITAKRDQLFEVASVLSAKRNESAPKLSNDVEEYLIPLAMTGAKFVVNLETVADEKSPFVLNDENVKIFKNGFDRCEFLFSGNPDTPPAEMKKVASGGELSRVALALKIALPTAETVDCTVFDEVDAGIGGQTAVSLAEEISKLSQKKQVIVITHLPQIARKANTHISIEKTYDGSSTRVFSTNLHPDEREKELARMISFE